MNTGYNYQLFEHIRWWGGTRRDGSTETLKLMFLDTKHRIGKF